MRGNMAALLHLKQQHTDFQWLSIGPSCRNMDGCDCRHNTDIFFYGLNCLTCVRSCTVAYVICAYVISCLLCAGLHPANEVKHSCGIDLIQNTSHIFLMLFKYVCGILNHNLSKLWFTLQQMLKIKSG